MKTILPPLILYLIVCAIALFIPASEGYNTFGWKLYVAQIYALPIFLIATVVTLIINKRRSQT